MLCKFHRASESNIKTGVLIKNCRFLLMQTFSLRFRPKHGTVYSLKFQQIQGAAKNVKMATSEGVRSLPYKLWHLPNASVRPVPPLALRASALQRGTRRRPAFNLPASRWTGIMGAAPYVSPVRGTPPDNPTSKQQKRKQVSVTET